MTAQMRESSEVRFTKAGGVRRTPEGFGRNLTYPPMSSPTSTTNATRGSTLGGGGSADAETPGILPPATSPTTPDTPETRKRKAEEAAIAAVPTPPRLRRMVEAGRLTDDGLFQAKKRIRDEEVEKAISEALHPPPIAQQAAPATDSAVSSLPAPLHGLPTAQGALPPYRKAHAKSPYPKVGIASLDRLHDPAATGVQTMLQHVLAAPPEAIAATAPTLRTDCPGVARWLAMPNEACADAHPQLQALIGKRPDICQYIGRAMQEELPGAPIGIFESMGNAVLIGDLFDVLPPHQVRAAWATARGLPEPHVVTSSREGSGAPCLWPLFATTEDLTMIRALVAPWWCAI
eukprot:scaffold520_cov224-Pinguiococcus_pyrenoidosus.AAC.1